METLPLEILVAIASHDHRVWRGMLVIRIFAEHTFQRSTKNYVLRVFGKINRGRETTLLGKFHSYFDQPAKYINTEHIWFEIHQEEDNSVVRVHCGEIKEWYHRGELHRGGDLPAVICRKDRISYHDEDCPERNFDVKEEHWYRAGKLYRKNTISAEKN